MKAMQVISLTLLLVVAARAMLKSGRCPQPAVQANFDASRYLGKWYEIQKLPAVFQRGQCTTANYSVRGPGEINVLNSELLNDGTIKSGLGIARVKNPAEPAKLEVSFPNSPPGPYWVLSTDYDGHSLVYSCTDFGLFHMELTWILSRKPTLPEETVEGLRRILSSTGVCVDNMVSTIQDESYCSVMNQQKPLFPGGEMKRMF